jgi:hypothetical protein
MRRNGVPEFRDPDKDGVFPRLGSGSGPRAISPQFQKADTACSAFKPKGDVGGAPGGGS